MKRREIFKRYALFVVSLFFIGLGIALTKHSGLGVSAISSIANVMSCKFSAISIGNWLVIWNFILITGQILILGKNFEPIQLLQLPLSLFFGIFTDIGMKIAGLIHVEAYLIRILVVVFGNIILSFGIFLSVTANVIMNSSEAFVKAISDSTHKKFGNIKIIFDICCMVVASVLSLCFFDFTLIGIREGTVISAFLVGGFVKVYSRLFGKSIGDFLSEKKT